MSSAVFIGAGRGFGLAAAKLLGAQGLSICLADINRENLEAGSEALEADDVRVHASAFDAQDSARMEEFAHEAELFDPPIVAVVSMVGGSLATTRWLAEVSSEDVRSVIKFCVAPALNAANAFREPLKRGGGALVLVSSSAARLGDRLGWSPPYAFGKGAILGLARFLSCDLLWEGVRVSAVCPGDVATERTAEIHTSGIMTDDEVNTVLHQRNMLRRMATPNEVGSAIAHLATNGFASGTILDINGGEFPTPA